jgi:hypothetical protein
MNVVLRFWLALLGSLVGLAGGLLLVATALVPGVIESMVGPLGATSHLGLSLMTVTSFAVALWPLLVDADSPVEG